jgi:hypothetical protein
MSKTTIPTGGITDGTIATGDLADDAVTAAKIADAVGLGKVLQTQSVEGNGRTTISSGSFTSVNNLSDTITCAATSSKVLVLVNAQFGADSNNADVTNVGAKFKLFRNHSGISDTEIFSIMYQHNRPENSGMDMIFQNVCTFMYLDSPSTTNELTYSVQALNDPSTSGLEVIQGGSNEFDLTITLIEIGA